MTKNQYHHNDTGTVAILRLARVMKITGLCRSSVYAKLNAASKSFDPEFPKPVPIGTRARGWLASEVDGWVQQRAAMRFTGRAS